MRFGTAPASAGAFLWVDIAGRDLGADCYGAFDGAAICRKRRH